MLIRSFKLNKKIIIFTIILVFLAASIMIFYSFANGESTETTSEDGGEKNFIKWVDFNVTSEALNLTAKLDINSHNNNEEIKYNWIELLAYLACQNGGNFKNFKETHLNNLVDQLKKRANNTRFNQQYEILRLLF